MKVCKTTSQHQHCRCTWYSEQPHVSAQLAAQPWVPAPLRASPGTPRTIWLAGTRHAKPSALLTSIKLAVLVLSLRRPAVLKKTDTSKSRQPRVVLRSKKTHPGVSRHAAQHVASVVGGPLASCTYGSCVPFHLVPLKAQSAAHWHAPLASLQAGVSPVAL